jgi:myo-inositol-1-phosphate synthase
MFDLQHRDEQGKDIAPRFDALASRKEMGELTMTTFEGLKKIRLAIAGLGNCASSLIEGLTFYKRNTSATEGLLFPSLCGYSVRDVEVVAVFDIASPKVGRPVCEAIYQRPNNFVRIENVGVDISLSVLRGPTLDGNPPHLATFVAESPSPPVDVESVLRECTADILINLLPTGSIEATQLYAKSALKAGCAFVNCIPAPLAQRVDFQELYSAAGLPVFGDDIKSQMGTTILHRALLSLLKLRGASLKVSSQVNIGGNTDFANFVYRGETKLASKQKSLQRNAGKAASHIGHHYDPTKGPLKNALIHLEASVFGGSRVKIDVRLESDDKPNSAGSVIDLIRLAKACLDRGISGAVPEVCASYMKSPPTDMADLRAFELILQNWLTDNERAGLSGEDRDWSSVL